MQKRRRVRVRARRTRARSKKTATHARGDGVEDGFPTPPTLLKRLLARDARGSDRRLLQTFGSSSITISCATRAPRRGKNLWMFPWADDPATDAAARGGSRSRESPPRTKDSEGDEEDEEDENQGDEANA